jgi:hypothetical protein
MDKEHRETKVSDKKYKLGNITSELVQKHRETQVSDKKENQGTEHQKWIKNTGRPKCQTRKRNSGNRTSDMDTEHRETQVSDKKKKFREQNIRNRLRIMTIVTVSPREKLLIRNRIGSGLKWDKGSRSKMALKKEKKFYHVMRTRIFCSQDYDFFWCLEALLEV